MTLETFFKENSAVALGFSGGTDSSFLLWAAKNYGARVAAYFVKTPFQPEFELEDAKRMASDLGAELRIIEYDILSQPDVRENPENRCYYCKSAIFSLIARRAKEDGWALIIDGTNASDDAGDRPGMSALTEIGVRSPLRECGITKAQVRSLSKDAGLFTWDKPAYACLATRIPAGDEITCEKLARVEKGEAALYGLGFSDLRLRLRGNGARLELPVEQHPRAKELWSEVLSKLRDFEHLELVIR